MSSYLAEGDFTSTSEEERMYFHGVNRFPIMAFCRFQSKISLLWTAMVSSSCSILDMMVITRSRTSSVLHEPHDGALGESWCAGLQIRLEQDGVASIGDLLLSCLEVSECWRRSSSSRWLSQPNHKIVMNMQNK